jgi:excisionase family DNA binding protein
MDLAAPSQKLLLTVSDVAEALSISRTRVFALFRAGELSSVKVGRRRLVTTASVEAYVARLSSQ